MKHNDKHKDKSKNSKVEKLSKDLKSHEKLDKKRMAKMKSKKC